MVDTLMMWKLPNLYLSLPSNSLGFLHTVASTSCLFNHLLPKVTSHLPSPLPAIRSLCLLSPSPIPTRMSHFTISTHPSSSFQVHPLERIQTPFIGVWRLTAQRSHTSFPHWLSLLESDNTASINASTWEPPWVLWGCHWLLRVIILSTVFRACNQVPAQAHMLALLYLLR